MHVPRDRPGTGPARRTRPRGAGPTGSGGRGPADAARGPAPGCARGRGSTDAHDPPPDAVRGGRVVPPPRVGVGARPARGPPHRDPGRRRQARPRDAWRRPRPSSRASRPCRGLRGPRRATCATASRPGAWRPRVGYERVRGRSSAPSSRRRRARPPTTRAPTVSRRPGPGPTARASRGACAEAVTTHVRPAYERPPRVPRRPTTPGRARDGRASPRSPAARTRTRSPSRRHTTTNAPPEAIHSDRACRGARRATEAEMLEIARRRTAGFAGSVQIPRRSLGLTRASSAASREERARALPGRLRTDGSAPVSCPGSFRACRMRGYDDPRAEAWRRPTRPRPTT